jgi:hypothetical protein
VESAPPREAPESVRARATRLLKRARAASEDAPRERKAKLDAIAARLVLLLGAKDDATSNAQLDREAAALDALVDGRAEETW